ncbi:MAG TPA: hypothetical protein VMD59_06675 [Acidimicrobiales bacterium]|nr:hypothetical protein [Acidimicrobiales bacterium]
MSDATLLPVSGSPVAGSPVAGRVSGGLDRQAAVATWLARCRALAEASLDSVEAPADELAALAGGDRRTMEIARRAILEALERDPGNCLLRQMQSFWRRAFEKGSWDWDCTDVADVGGILS